MKQLLLRLIKIVPIPIKIIFQKLGVKYFYRLTFSKYDIELSSRVFLHLLV